MPPEGKERGARRSDCNSDTLRFIDSMSRSKAKDDACLFQRCESLDSRHEEVELPKALSCRSSKKSSEFGKKKKKSRLRKAAGTAWLVRMKFPLIVKGLNSNKNVEKDSYWGPECKEACRCRSTFTNSTLSCSSVHGTGQSLGHANNEQALRDGCCEGVTRSALRCQ